MSTLAPRKKLNEAQLMLLKLFSREVSRETMNKMRKLLVDFFDEVVQAEINKLSEKKNLTQTSLDKLKESHPKRKPYPS